MNLNCRSCCTSIPRKGKANHNNNCNSSLFNQLWKTEAAETDVYSRILRVFQNSLSPDVINICILMLYQCGRALEVRLSDYSGTVPNIYMQDVRYTGNSKQQYPTVILRQLFHTKMLSTVLPVVNFSINLVLQTFFGSVYLYRQAASEQSLADGECSAAATAQRQRCKDATPI